jgi:hypothetical protein
MNFKFRSQVLTVNTKDKDGDIELEIWNELLDNKTMSVYLNPDQVKMLIEYLTAIS